MLLKDNMNRPTEGLSFFIDNDWLKLFHRFIADVIEKLRGQIKCSLQSKAEFRTYKNTY